MFSVFIVPVKPVLQVFGKLCASLVCLQIDSLVLQGSTAESFDEDIVLETPFAIHADPDIPGFEDGGECFAGELASMVGVEELRCTAPPDTFNQHGKYDYPPLVAAKYFSKLGKGLQGPFMIVIG